MACDIAPIVLVTTLSMIVIIEFNQLKDSISQFSASLTRRALCPAHCHLAFGMENGGGVDIVSTRVLGAELRISGRLSQSSKNIH